VVQSAFTFIKSSFADGRYRKKGRVGWAVR
jgi:hypothetical protein